MNTPAKFACRYYPGARCNHLYCGRPLKDRAPVRPALKLVKAAPKPKGGA